MRPAVAMAAVRATGAVHLTGEDRGGLEQAAWSVFRRVHDLAGNQLVVGWEEGYGPALDEADGRRLEPLVWPYRDAVVVAQESLRDAVHALRERPWSVIVSGVPTAPPSGVTSCPPAASQFLSALADRSDSDRDPVRSRDSQLGVTIIAGCEPIAGRDARVRAAERALERAQQSAQTARSERDHRQLALEQSVAEHQRALAAAALPDAASAQHAAETELDRRTHTEREAGDGEQRAQRGERDLALELRGLDLARADAGQWLERGRQAIGQHSPQMATLRLEVRTSRDTAEMAARDWGQGEAQARAWCAEDPRDAGGLRNRANEALHEALLLVGLRSDGEEAPTQELLDAWRRKSEDDSLPFPQLAEPLGRHLVQFAERDLVLAALLAVPHPEGRVLVLDELGDSLGFQHRRDVLRAIAGTAAQKGITVLGTCQDDVLHHAAEFTQEIVFFEYSDHRHLLNRPARLFGFDPNGRRVEMHRDAVLAGRPRI